MLGVARRARAEAGLYVRDPFRRMAVHATLMRPLRTRQFAHFGSRSIIHRPDWIAGADRIWIGDGTLILHSSWLSVEAPARSLPAPVIRLGDRVGIRPYVTISAAESIVIEDDVIVSAFSSIIDCDHTFAAGIPNVMHNPLVSTPIRIGRGTWIAERCAVLRGSDIGRCCIIGANSVVRGVIPDYSVAVGAPARVVGSTRHFFQDGAAD